MKFPWHFFSFSLICAVFSVPLPIILLLTFVRLRLNYFAFNHVILYGKLCPNVKHKFILAYIHKQCFFSLFSLSHLVRCLRVRVCAACECLYASRVNSSMQVYVSLYVCVCMGMHFVGVSGQQCIVCMCSSVCCLSSICLCMSFDLLRVCVCVYIVPVHSVRFYGTEKFSYFKCPAQYYEIVQLRKNKRANDISPLTPKLRTTLTFRCSSLRNIAHRKEDSYRKCFFSF